MLSQLKFTQLLYQKMLEEYGPASHSPIKELVLLESQINVIGQQGETFTCYTDRIYHRYLQKPKQINEIFTQTLQTYKDLFLHDEGGANDVLPFIRNQEWLEEAYRMRIACYYGEDPQDSKLLQEQMLTLPLAGDLIIAFAINLAKGAKFLYQNDLSRYFPGDTLLSVYQKAKDNLTNYLHKLTIQPSPIGYTLELNAEIEPSMFLLYEHWQDKLPFQGPPVIALLARDTVILADSSDPGQVCALQKFAQEVYPTAAYHLSPEIFTLKEGVLELYEQTL